MKRSSNVAARAVMVQRYSGATEYLWWVPRIPNFVWLAMVILTVVALSISTLMRSWDQEEDARASYSYTQDRVEKAKGENREIRERTDRIRKDPRVAAQVAHDQLRLLRANEVVVAVR